MVAPIETYAFQAETKHLLDLMIHSLYTTKAIFLRELISNASDALDALRFEALINPELTPAEKLEIRLETDPQARTLTIHDNGIGMSRAEVIANIGTIAKSGTRELREKLQQDLSGKKLTELIGQFGVGFYSSFMVSERVTLVTRRAGEQTATRWDSTGDGQYTIGEATRDQRGSSITLHLKPADPEDGVEDYTDKWILARTVKRYSDFVTYPIVFQDVREELEKDEAGNPKASGAKSIVIEDKILNSMKPLWMRPAAEVSESDYAEFYKHLTHEQSEPLKTIALKAEGTLEYQALLFIPSQASYDFFYHATEWGLHLYAKGVSIIERCEDLLPRYLRFIRGIVDSADLPLNISRQMLQQDRQVGLIRKWLTKKVLDSLQAMSDEEPHKFQLVWEQFGRALKEGVASDYDNKTRLVSLLRFQSSHDEKKLTTLKEYVERMKEGQEEIFYLTGESRRIVENSPHLETLKAEGYEVLYLVDSVDELVTQYLTEFDGRKLKSAGKGTVKVGDKEESAQTEKELKEKAEESSELLSFIQRHLDQYVKEVRPTNRLTTSPVCLVGTDMDYSPQMERLLQMGEGARPKQRRIMELNPQHEIFKRMRARFQKNKDEIELGKYADLLLSYALLAEGSDLPDPVGFNQLVAELMIQTLST
ncbi:MAG TPA: molecular chaperone HtpG [Pyrinomonadaceae bacterium]|jgi:molecular chaperone HtpG|nr:molecular chaperone HtpG [Pyrinomonadaceae bacterium]